MSLEIVRVGQLQSLNAVHMCKFPLVLYLHNCHKRTFDGLCSGWMLHDELLAAQADTQLCFPLSFYPALQHDSNSGLSQMHLGFLEGVTNGGAFPAREMCAILFAYIFCIAKLNLMDFRVQDMTSFHSTWWNWIEILDNAGSILETMILF